MYQYQSGTFSLAKRYTNGRVENEAGLAVYLLYHLAGEEALVSFDEPMERQSGEAALWERLLGKFGTVYAREPGIVVRRAVSPDDGISSLFAIEFWKQFKTYASVTA